jgi:uncharacterized protein (TIGR03437 family)
MSGLNPIRYFFALSALAMCCGLLHAADTLTLAPSSVALTCAKGSASGSPVSVAVTDAAATDYFAVGAASVPYWLQVTPMNGSASASSQNLVFQTSAASVNLPVGVYTASVQITGSNLVTASVPVTLQVSDNAPGLNVQPVDPYAVNWQIGQPYPSLSLTVFSTTTVPVPFIATITSSPTVLGVTDWLTPYSVQSIAYGWGTTIPLVVSQLAYQQAQAGEVMQALVTITYGASSTKLVHVNITVTPPPAAILALSPASVPVISTSSAGTVTIAINGSNFVQNSLQTTRIFTGSATSVSVCSACTVHVLNTQNLTVAIPYDATGAPFKTAGTLTIGLANGATNTPQSTKNLAITNAPIVTSITSASTLVAPIAGSNPTVAPYDVISIFGSNFCPASITGCANPIVASLDSNFRYPTFLSPDTNTHKITVMFSKIANVGTAWSNVPGYLLFANNTQINAVVPAGIAAQLGTSTVKVVVAFDTSATNPATANSSTAYILNVAAVDPGAFTLDATGEGAILDASTYILNTQSTPATGGTSTVSIFMTGLGVPNSAETNTPQASSNPPTTCLAPLGAAGSASAAPTGYMGTVNTSVAGGGYTPPSGYTAPGTPWTSIDGAIVRSVLLSANVNPPCFGATGNPLPVVTIGAQSAVVSYAGFVPDSIAGLYQVNVAVPNVGNGSSSAQFPIAITMGGVAAPTIQIWVQ